MSNHIVYKDFGVNTIFIDGIESIYDWVEVSENDRPSYWVATNNDGVVVQSEIGKDDMIEQYEKSFRLLQEYRNKINKLNND